MERLAYSCRNIDYENAKGRTVRTKTQVEEENGVKYNDTKISMNMTNKKNFYLFFPIELFADRTTIVTRHHRIIGECRRHIVAAVVIALDHQPCICVVVRLPVITAIVTTRHRPSHIIVARVHHPTIARHRRAVPLGTATARRRTAQAVDTIVIDTKVALTATDARTAMVTITRHVTPHHPNHENERDK